MGDWRSDPTIDDGGREERGEREKKRDYIIYGALEGR
jgi:hypothetical protein